ncbi:MAG TPA: cytidine deaminase [Bryobacteraceae bacterium]|nr:cytidine deaminase [Bryobacteraceae bacterium]HPT28152.1 cytidine deaminase [Bryobacteraceae bacterium]
MSGTTDLLLSAAIEARENARPDFSGFKVGAAVEASDGRIFSGCNVESASYGLTICAERTAIFCAIAAGAKSFRQAVVVTAADKLTPPCGACRQVLWEFCGDLEITLANLTGARRVFRLSQLLPEPFDAKNLD